MVTGIYTALCSLMFLYLAWPIASLRKQKKIGLGDGSDPELQRAIRVHGNFIEHVPITLLMLWLAEAQGTPLAVIHGLSVALIGSRILHAYGLSRSGGYSFGRFYGTAGTWLVMIILSALLLWSGLA